MRVPLPVVRTVLALTVRPVCGPQVPIRLQRRYLDLMSSRTPLPKGVTVTDVQLAGRPARRYSAPGASTESAVLWAHGGAFITGGYATHGSFAAHLAVAVGSPVYLLDYRLAPEHQHPAAVDDLVAALPLIPEQRVVMGGDSAGGTLALLTADRSPRPLSGVALVSPVVDLAGELRDAYDGKDALIRSSWGRMGVNAMFGRERFPMPVPTVPTVVHVSEHERLRAEGEKLAADCGAELVVVPDAWHDIHLQAGLVRRADEALAQLAASIKAFLV
jgi:monoterpene epsilon-lactone hydrolase